nr:hypothetical protein BaRGS_024345 [Batillaria attramentaria]
MFPKWDDYRLSWSTNPTYSAIPVIQVHNDRVWTPSLVVDNNVLDLTAIAEDTIPLRVRQDGQVTWNPPGILVTSCEMDTTDFPFDTQTCSLSVTSFGYTIQELNISVHDTGINQKYYTENGEWHLQSTWNERSEFDEDGYTYAKMTFYFEMHRRPVYYGLNTLLPVMLTSLLIPMVFLLPHDSGEKIGYCLTVLLAYVVILTIVTDGLPTTAKNQSLLGVYIAMVLSLSGLSVVFSIHSLQVYHRDPNHHQLPLWQAKLTRNILWFIRMRCCKRKGGPRAITSVTPATEKGDKKLHSWNGGRVASAKGHVTSASHVHADVEEEGEVEAENGEITWQLVGHAYDAVLLRVYLLFIAFSSVFFIFAMAFAW